MLWLLTLLLALPDAPHLAPAPDSNTADIIHYGGRHALFLARENRVVLLDSAWVRYRDMTVYADSINYRIDKKILSAHRNVKFRTQTEEVLGSELFYNVDTRRGMMRNARTRVENGYLTAREAWLVKEKVINARNAFYTTCDHDPPHYTFWGPRVKLLMDDVAITQPVVLRIAKLPILAAPFWLVPVASKRKSGLMPFKVGNSKEQGYYAKGLSYYWVLNDYADVTFFLDLMTKKGIQFRSEAVYIVEPFVRGAVQGSYIREMNNPPSPARPRYSFNLTSAGKVSPKTDFNIQTELLSDTAYAPDYAEDRLDWLKQEIYSYASLRHNFAHIGRFSIRGERHTYYMRHYQYSYLPSISFSFNTRTLPGGWDISPNLSFSRQIEEYDSAGIDTIYSQRLAPRMSFNLTSPEYPLGRIDINDQLSLTAFQRRFYLSPPSRTNSLNHELNLASAQKLFGFFNTSEGVVVKQEENLTDTLPLEPAYSLYISGNIPLFRVFTFRSQSIHGVLHTLTPGFQFTYEPSVIPRGILGRPRWGKPENALIIFNVNNGFQAKVGENRQKVDCGTANLSTYFDIIRHHLGPVTGAVSIRPLALFPSVDTGFVRNRLDLSIDGNLSFNTDSLRLGDYAALTTFSWTRTHSDSILHQERGWELRLNHTFARNQHMLTGSISFAVAGWRLGFNSFGYNFTRRQLTDYSINLWRDLHCWEAVVNLTGLGKQWRYDFEVRIKKLPDVRFGKSTFRTFLP